MNKTAPQILEKHCPSMHDLYLDQDTRPFRDRIVLAMEEYASPLKKRIEELEAGTARNEINFQHATR